MTATNGSARPVASATDASDEKADGRASSRPNPEVVAHARRRRVNANYKQKILAEVDAAQQPGEIDRLLRRHGLYSSHLSKGRRERETGILGGLTPRKRGPKVKSDPRAQEYQKLQRENERLADQLRKAEIIIDVQKKVAMLLGRPFSETTEL